MSISTEKEIFDSLKDFIFTINDKIKKSKEEKLVFSTDNEY